MQTGMKWLFFILTILTELALIHYWGIFDNFQFSVGLWAGLISLAVISGVKSKSYSKITNDLSWGFLYGTLTTTALAILFVIYIVVFYRV